MYVEMRVVLIFSSKSRKEMDAVLKSLSPTTATPKQICFDSDNML